MFIRVDDKVSHLTSSGAGRFGHHEALDQLDRGQTGPHELLSAGRQGSATHHHEPDPTTQDQRDLVEHQAVQDRGVVTPLVPLLLLVVAELKDLPEVFALLGDHGGDVFVNSVKDQGHSAHDCWSQQGGVALLALLDGGGHIGHGVGAAVSDGDAKSYPSTLCD